MEFSTLLKFKKNSTNSSVVKLKSLLLFRTQEHAVMEVMKTVVVIVLVVMVMLPKDAVTASHLSPTMTSNPTSNITRPTAGRRRHTRALKPMTAKEIRQAVSLHNKMRRNEGSSDMQMLEWDENLAKIAAGWADRCIYWHGQPNGESDPESELYKQYESNGGIRQSLYAKVAEKISLSHAIEVSWGENERRHYNYKTGKCTRGKQCSHYVAMIYSNLRHVGCAYKRCAELKKEKDKPDVWKNAINLVCNYHPDAAIDEFPRPFLKGPPCTQCENGASWCTDKLCNRACTAASDDCVCAAQCHNCAKLDLKTCRCSCVAGWRGADCSRRCEDTHKTCNKGWHKYSCKKSLLVNRSCHAMCGYCTVDKSAAEGLCPIVYANPADANTTNVSSEQTLRNNQHAVLVLVIMIALAVSICKCLAP